MHYRAASTLDPTLPNPYSNEGVALLNLGRPRDAIKPLEAAVKLRPNHLEDLNSLGDALADSERYEEGIQRYRQAIDAAPAGYFPKSLYSMLHYLIHTCRWKELEEACKVRLDKLLGSKQLLEKRGGSARDPDQERTACAKISWCWCLVTVCLIFRAWRRLCRERWRKGGRRR